MGRACPTTAPSSFRHGANSHGELTRATPASWLYEWRVSWARPSKRPSTGEDAPDAFSSAVACREFPEVFHERP